MVSEIILILGTLSFYPTPSTDDIPAIPSPNSPAARYQAILAEHRVASEELDHALAAAKNKAEKLALTEVNLTDRFTGRLLDLALERPADPWAYEALSWIVLRGGSDPAWGRAMTILSADHLRNPKVTDLFASLEFDPRVEAETLLQKALSSDGDRRIRGLACLTLARRRLAASHFARAGQDRSPENLRILRRLFGVETIRAMMHDDSETLRTQAVSYFDRAAREFGEVLSGATPLGELAGRESFAARFLNVGQVAPEIEGVDGDGIRFKLSDYRGKAILLIFCGDWCLPCRAAYPHERALAQALQGRPFAMLVVNSDADKDKLKARMAQERMPIRYWLDGSPPDGPIASTWNITSYPTVYVIDATGVIRYAALGYKKDQIAEMLERTLKESGHGVKLSDLIPIE